MLRSAARRWLLGTAALVIGCRADPRPVEPAVDARAGRVPLAVPALSTSATPTAIDPPPAPAPSADAEPPASDPENRTKPPLASADLDARAAHLLDAIVKNEPALADDFFFPRDP